MQPREVSITIRIERKNYLLLRATLQILDNMGPGYVRGNLRLKFASAMRLLVSFSNYKNDYFPTHLSEENVHIFITAPRLNDLAELLTYYSSTLGVQAEGDFGPGGTYKSQTYSLEYIFTN
jgi:hypothetical protein